ncbi:PRC-barrel domain-containing protein [Pseudalkalibacillus hwajinpoensis]|uniref:PRC-barrel domain-containing protein n=1 Tax=Guptibacillus hwajinpoensis TaxID=208199 RepID=UPI00325A50BC
MIKVGEKLNGSKLSSRSTAEFKVKQIYFDSSLRRVTYVELDRKEASNEKDAVPDHHAGEMLHSIQASGGQFTPDNYPVTDDDRKTKGVHKNLIVPYNQLTWKQDSITLNEHNEEVQSAALADQHSYTSLHKAEVLTEDGEELGKVKEVVIKPDGEIDGLELSKGFLSDFLSSEHPYLKLNESVNFQHGKVIVPAGYHHYLKK